MDTKKLVCVKSRTCEQSRSVSGQTDQYEVQVQLNPSQSINQSINQSGIFKVA